MVRRPVAYSPVDAAVPGVGAAVVDLIVSAAVGELTVHGAVALIYGRAPPVSKLAWVWIHAESGLRGFTGGRGLIYQKRRLTNGKFEEGGRDD